MEILWPLGIGLTIGFVLGYCVGCSITEPSPREEERRLYRTARILWLFLRFKNPPAQ